MINTAAARGASERVLIASLFSFQMEIKHKNQVPTLVGPQPKTRSFFSFLTRDFQKQDNTFEEYLE
jgi:hypothetical protein